MLCYNCSFKWIFNGKVEPLAARGKPRSWLPFSIFFYCSNNDNVFFTALQSTRFCPQGTKANLYIMVPVNNDRQCQSLPYLADLSWQTPSNNPFLATAPFKIRLSDRRGFRKNFVRTYLLKRKTKEKLVKNCIQNDESARNYRDSFLHFPCQIWVKTIF